MPPSPSHAATVRFMRLVTAISLVALLAGAGCTRPQAPAEADGTPPTVDGSAPSPTGREVRDPAGRWHTFLSPGFELDPGGLPHAASLGHAATTATVFSVVKPRTPSEEDPPVVAEVSVFPRPAGSLADLYAPLATGLYEVGASARTPARRTVDGLDFLVVDDPVAMLPTTYYAAERGPLAIEIILYGGLDADARHLLTYLVTGLAPLR